MDVRIETTDDMRGGFDTDIHVLLNHRPAAFQ